METHVFVNVHFDSMNTKEGNPWKICLSWHNEMILYIEPDIEFNKNIDKEVYDAFKQASYFRGLTKVDDNIGGIEIQSDTGIKRVPINIFTDTRENTIRKVRQFLTDISNACGPDTIINFVVESVFDWMHFLNYCFNFDKGRLVGYDKVNLSPIILESAFNQSFLTDYLESKEDFLKKSKDMLKDGSEDEKFLQDKLKIVLENLYIKEIFDLINQQ